MKLAQKCSYEPRTQIECSQASKDEKRNLEPRMRVLHENGEGNKKRKKIKSILRKLWGKKPQEHLYESWKKKKKKMHSSHSLEELVHNYGEWRFKVWFFWRSKEIRLGPNETWLGLRFIRSNWKHEWSFDSHGGHAKCCHIWVFCLLNC